MSQDSAKTKLRKSNILGIVAAIVLACGIFYMSSIPGSGLPKNLGFWTTVAHFCEYLLLGIFISLAFSCDRRGFWVVLAIAVVLASAYGASDEIHQIFTPGRTPDVLDWLTDTIGAFVGSYIFLKVRGHRNS